MPQPASILIDSLIDARAALAAARDAGAVVNLRVREETAAALGADVIARIFALAREEFPGVEFVAAVECGNAPGLAIAVLRRGIQRVTLRGPADMLARVADIAASCGGAALDNEPSPALDLRSFDEPRRACGQWLRDRGTGG